MSLPPLLIDHICSRRTAITDTWLQALGSPEFSTPEKIPTPQLVDHLPNLFDELAAYMRGEGGPQVEHDARLHGRYRWKQNFRLDEVVRELFLFRDVIVAEIERYIAGHEPSATLVSMEARLLVNRFFDDVLLYSASQFSEQQQSQSEADMQRAAQQRRTAQNETRAVEAARLRLLRTIAHELRNMLNTAAIAVTSLPVEEDPACRADLHEMLRRSHQQMAALVSQLLEMAPLLARREAPRLAPLDLQTFTAELCRLFEHMAASKHLKFRCDVPKELPEVITDELKLHRIVTNLVQNALKYTPQGGSVELRVEPLDGECWKLSVADTGPGIPEKHRTRIFKEFYRVPGSEQQEGTGLGLSIVRQLVTALRGEITVESQVGNGTTFCVIFPRDSSKPPNQRLQRTDSHSDV